MKKQQDNNTQNKKFRILLGILILWLMCGQTLWAQTTNKYYSIDIYADSYAGGDGSKTNPYEIATAEQLAKLARDVNNGNTPQAFLGKYFKLTADIDLSGGIWMPIGKYYNKGYGNGDNRLFFGKFDGNGHVIKNMHIQWEGTEAWSAWGLFSTLQGASSTNLTTVTNLIIEKATVEKKREFKPYGPGYKVGVVAGEIYSNTELSNIIIHGSEIKDNDETYEINNESKIGGIAGNVQTDSKNETFRIFNIAADTQINMLKNTSVHNDKFHIAQGFGHFNYDMKGGDNIIEPTNIYLFGNGLNIENTSTNINKGGITANCKNEDNANKYASTWYYTQNVTGGKNLGTQKTDASFKKEFVDKANEFINKNPLVEDKNTWNFSDGKFTLNKKMEIYVVEKKYNRNETQVAYTLDVKNATTTYNYTWKVDNEQITPVEGSNGTTIRLPLSNKKRKGSVTLKDSKTQQVIQTKYFDINPKYYSIDLYADNYTRGTGTKEDPFIISSDLELAKLARDVQNKQLQENKYFKLAKDISLDKGLWMPIGTTNNNGAVFKGKFDGDGHTIDNMHISWADNSSPWNDWALFATVQGTAANEAGFCRITNLIIDNALIEKEPSPNQNEKSGNVAVLVGEVLTKGYVEISNIIVRNSIITDYNDTYTRKQFRVGGIIGNLDDNHETRLFNLSSDVEIKMLSNARLNDECYMAEGIGRYGNPNTGNSYVIPLTNIYVHNKLETSNTSNKLKIGGVIGNKDMGAGNSATENWYYASPVSGTQNNVMNNGTQKSLADFAMTFVNQNNTYISDKNIEDKNTWTYTEGTGFAFGSTTLTVERGVNAVITAETIKGNGANEKYFWYTSSDKKTWKLQNENAASNPFTLPREEYDQYVYAVLEDGSSRSGIIKIEAIRVEATMNNDASSNLLTILVTNNIWENNDNLNITYKWVKNDDEQNPVGNGPTYDKSTLGINDKLSCLVTVTTRDENPKVLFNKWLYFAKSVVYLCPARATGTAANGNTTEYNQGNDSNDGHTPETAVKTWKGAYSKLAKEGTWADNIIVLMGMSDKDVTNNGNDGFTSVTFNTSSEWENKKSTSPFFKNTTITGSWNDVDYGGVIQMRGGNERSDGLPIYGDTRFQHLTFKRNDYSGEKYDILYCQFYNLEMGEGIQMINYTEPFNGDGTIDGAKSTSFQIFGGFMNDNRFAPLSTEGNLKKMDDALPHGHEGFKIKIKSGHYSTICVGGRQTVDQRNGVMGSPNMPIKCSIDVDIDREYNEAHKENNGRHTPTLDIAVILAGNHEGAIVGDVDIIIKSGKIGRVVNGSLGARRNTSNYNAPYNTYMGRANILIDPAHSESNNKNTDVNSRVEITEIYGGSAGRGFAGGQLVENPFYGYSTITIKGGTFKIPSECNSENIFSGIYGAGAGGMNGIGDDTYHTTDKRIPYWTNSSTKSVMAFGNYNTAKANLCMYNCYNADTHTYTEVDPRLTHNKIIIEGGIFGSETRKIDGIYAGGSGYMSKDLWKANSIPSKEGGNIYGKAGETVASLTINGGEFYCKNGIFAGGRGTDYFYSLDPKGGNAADYTELGKIYGNVELTINGGKFHCPVFGGGYGVADAKLLNSNNINTLENMARLYGSSTVKINGGTFFENIYGGGDMAVVEQGTNVAISDKADIRGDVFAGGNGRKKRLESNTTIADDTKHPELVGKVLGGTNLNFYGTSAQAPSIYGDIYGGGNRAQVEGNTYINIYAANFAGEIYGGGKGLITDDKGKLLAKDLYTYANVTGNTFVKLAQDQGAQKEGENGKKQDSFSINVIWDKKWNGTTWINWNDDKNKFFNDGQFVCSHNIYGGGNQACNVTGKATLTILKGMTPFGLLKTAEWKKAYDDSDHPHFAVFGGGYGINTTVGSTDVTVNVNGDYGIYNTEIEDDTEQLAKPHRSSSKSKNRRNAASSNKEEISVFDNSKGIPNFTILSALGGGYAGKVNDSTKVTIDGKTFLHRVYGGGFGDPSSTENNETGQIGGNTEVYIQGAKIYGDVFGGGAGVAPKDNTYFTDVAKVLGTTKVEISGEAKIYGNVYGGGDIANIKSYITRTGEDKKAHYNTKPKSESKLDQTTGKFLSYEAKDYTTFVNITGGDIFGEVFGGGKGLKKAEATEYYKVGRINGNTLVHVVNTNATSLADTDSQGNIVPFIWSNIYGGCAFGTVDGSTLVHIEGGKLGHNIYGGGYGNIKIDLTSNETEEEEEEITRNTVLGKVDNNKEGTYANILGSTKVQIDGGTWIWNRKADINGNITTWLAVQNNEKICENIDEFKEITAAILKAKTANEITNEKAKAAINRIISDENTQQFYAFTKGTMNSGSFKRDHNIYGGGNRACYVGFGQDGNSTIGNGTSDSNGLSEVIINHSPLADVITKDGNQISVFDETSLAGLCWYISSKNTNDPEFSIFGAGFGANTKVAKTEVCVQPGNKMDDDGVITVNGIKYRYLNQNADLKTYVDFEKQIYNDFLKVSKDDKKLYFGSVTGSNPGDADFDPMTFKRYHASRWAWTLGLPGFTFQAIHGGGFSGYVTGETYVETDCQPFCENIFGAGVGAMPIGNITTANQGESYDFGKVGSLSRVFIKSGYVAQNVYGGGAGIESIYDKNKNTWIDFPNMARVPKTEVYVYGRNIKYKQNLGLIARTMILGSVYGGGDVANVGNEKAKEAPDVFNFEHQQVPARHTSLVNIRGGVVFSQVFAGGRGRLKSECNDYKKLGGIYGNTSLVIDRPNITYPYFDEKTKEYIKPWSDNAMKHPDNDVNKDIMPAFLERIYGGCENGTVYGNTFMSISDGQIGHGIYGGGWGNCDTLTVNGTDSVNVTSADVTGNTNIMINGGQALLSSYWNPETRSWRPASIIDGIIYSPQYDHEALKFKVNHNIYAGGNEACVVGKDAYLTMEKGLLHDSTQMAYGVNKKFFETMAWKEIYNKVGSPHFCVFGGGYGEHTVIQGDTHVKINMEENNNRGHVDDIKKGEEYRHFLSGFSMMDIVGGGYSGKVVGNTHVEGSGGIFCRRVFGGGFYNSVNSTTVNIKAIDCHDIFGGGMMGDVIDSTSVNIGNPSAQNSNKAIFIHGNVYGGNDVSGYVNVSVKDGDFTDDNGSGTHINIYGGKIYGNVYGAGNGNYLYALDKNQNQKVTVNEYYPMNPEDPNSETVPLVYTVPMREFMPSYKGASDAAKIVNINSWRPLTNKVNIEIKGNSTSEKVNIAGDVYGGGNSATVQKVKSKDSKAVEKVGNIHINIGSHVNIGRVFMGCNGDELFAKSEDNDFMNKFQKLNGNVEDYTQELNLADTIDWFFNPSNKDIGTLYLPTKLEDRPTVYPHLIDLYFQPVETDIQGELLWNGNQTGKGLEDCTIKTFYCGGNRGNMNIYPDEKGNVINYIFPEGLTITDKIVGGCNNANYNYKGLVNHEGGYLLGRAYSTEPFIKLTIKNKFEPTIVNNEAYQGGCVYGGCYKTGTVRGDVTIDLQSDMLAGKEKAKLEKSNDYLASNPEYSSLNVYGAGYGMESYVYGNTQIIMGKDMKCSEPKTEGGKFQSCGVNGATGVSANFIYGGGQQGNVIGLTNVDILNGHVFRSVTGGSYSGYVYGSTQIKVGYPTYYQVQDGHSGIYLLDRTDKNNLYIDHENKKKDGKIRQDLASETIKQSIRLISGDKVSQAVYASIIGKQGVTNFVKENDFDAFTTAPASPLTWDDINIQIGEAIYGGGYSVAQGTSVMANDSTVLKYTRQYNIDKAFTERQEELAELPNGTTTGFGGNTTILVADNSATDSNRDHIIISHQKMKPVVLPEGTDLFGYYYMHEDGNYRYISLQDSYFYGARYKKPEHQLETDKNIYAYDSEGGIFGDGHQSYAAGFRSADLTGYGFAGTTINNPKIINTFQRMDILRLEDNCFNVLGARDYATNRTNKTPYSIARVGEIQMFAKNITLTDNKLQDKVKKRARNYMGLANNIHYVGAVTSNVPFNDATTEPWRNDTGMIPADGDFKGKSYMEVKQDYIDKYDQKTITEPIFQKRNDGTAKNMIGIASGYALKIQNVQELYDDSKKNVIDSIFYGPIYGVVEMNLIDVREDEGGGYVYADNVHKRATAEGETGHKVDFLETTGNFVFPYDAKQNRFVVDDCFPTGFYGMDEAGKANPDDKIDVHYWYVTGFNYYYNAHITGYTYKDKMTFFSDNKDGLTVLSGLKPNQPVTIQSWKMRSEHPEDKTKYSCDLEERNYRPAGTEGNVDMDNQDVSGKYKLSIGASSSEEYDGKGFAAVLPMNGKFNKDENYVNPKLPSKLTDGDAKISFQLTDNVNNTTTDYFKKHLSEKCLATVVLKGRAYEEYKDSTHNTPIISKVASSDFFTQEGNDYKQVTTGTKLSAGKEYYIMNSIAGEYTKIYPDRIYIKDSTAEDGYAKVSITDVKAGSSNYYCEVERIYTYTIYLTIEYVQGPNINGKITVDNCALPGEMVRLRKNQISIEADESFSANGYYWRIGKRKQNEKGNWVFEDDTEWDINKKATGYDTYKQGSSEAQGLFKDCVYDKTNDYLDIPAYYFMNGYGVQLGITMNGLKKIFTVDMADDSQFTVHNYHRMNPHQKGVNLHLSEAIQRSQEDKTFAEPRIYISDASDLKAFINFVDTIGTGTGSKAKQYGKNAQFVLQNDITVTSDFDGSNAVFAGTLHGNGHVIKGLAQGKSFLKENRGNIYNLGMESGNIAASNKGTYHCCFEYNKGIQPIVYHMDGKADTHYKADDFRYGKVGYDLNEYYLRARYSNNMENAQDKEALKYVYDYYANGDYQYAHRTDAITGNNTGITYLRKGTDSDQPNYGSNETRHDQSHAIDAARKASQGTASAVSYVPLFNGNQADESQPMNDFIFWGQSLQKLPDLYPSQIASHQNSYMRNRIYRTAGYYGDTKLDAFHYNASNNANSLMSTYVHQTTTTAIDFTCLNDKEAAMGFNKAADINQNGIFYPPVDDNAKVFSDLSIQQGVSQNLLIYTAANDIGNNTEAYDIADNALGYKENTSETTIYGHHIFKNNADGYTTSLLHLVERTPEGKNSEGDKCENNDFCAPIPFTVTNHAWYVRKPMLYAENTTGAWEGISLPFTVQKAVASLNGEITHFYGTPTEDELDNPATNTHTLHHEYWLRGLTSVNETEKTATFQRPDTTTGLFMNESANAAKWNYQFSNYFFGNTYKDWAYRWDADSYYAKDHEYQDYIPLTAGVPYIIRFPGERYYEFDLSSKFYNSILNKKEDPQTITFHAYGSASEEPQKKAIVIPITKDMKTESNGYAHRGTFAAKEVANGGIYALNTEGTAFSNTATSQTVMPFRTYLTTESTNAGARSSEVPSVIRISETTGIDRIEPEINGNDDTPAGESLFIRPIGAHRVRIESTYSTQLQVFSITGQLYRILDVRPGTATYSGFPDGIYIFGNRKIMVK